MCVWVSFLGVIPKKLLQFEICDFRKSFPRMIWAHRCLIKTVEEVRKRELVSLKRLLLGGCASF